MKRLKILSLTSLGVAALLVFAATASASTITSEGSLYTGTIEATATSSEEAPLTLGGVECESSTIKSKVEAHGTGVTAKAGISQLTFEKCTGEWTLTVKSLGALQFHKTSFFPELAFVTVSGLTINTLNHFGTSCNYVPNENILGVLLQSVSTKSTARLTVSAGLELESGDMECSEEIGWSGKYIVNTPDSLDVDLS